MTTLYVPLGHHRRTSSLPVFDDPPTFSIAEGGFRGGAGGQVEKESLIFKRNPPSSPHTTQTPRRSGDDYWSKRGLTTARSGEIISSGTSRRNSETQPSNIDDHVFTPMWGSALPPTGNALSKVTPLGLMTPSSPTKTFYWSSSSTTKPGGSGQMNYSSTLDRLRSPSTLNAGKLRGMADTDDRKVSSWEESFQKFNFSTSPSEKVIATDDWKKEFLHKDQELRRSHSPSGNGTLGQRNTLTRLSGGGMVSRNVGSQRGYVSDSEDSWNWLEKQREKLASKRAMQNLSHQRLDIEDQLNRQSSEVERKLLTELRASQSSLRGRTSESDLRYRARSMDNVGLNTDEYDINYSKFGPSFQRKGSSTLRSRGSTVANGGSTGSGERPPACQTLPRGARFQENSSRERPPLGQTPYSVRTLRPGEERFNQVPVEASTGGRSSGGRHLLGVNAKKRQDDEKEEITLRPIGPGVQPLESPDRVSTLTRSMQKHLIRSIDKDNVKISSDVPPIVFTPATPMKSSVSTLPLSSTGNRSTRLNETLPLFNTETGNTSVPPEVQTNVGSDEIVVEQAVKPEVPLSGGTVLDNIQSDRSRETSFEVYRNHGPSRSIAVEADQPKAHIDSGYTSPQRQGQQQQQQIQQQQQQQRLQQPQQYEWSSLRELSSTDQPEHYSGVTSFQKNHSTKNIYRTQPAVHGERTVPVPQNFPVVQQDQKYLTMQHNQTSEEGPKRSENFTNQLGPRQLNASRGYQEQKQLPNGQQAQLLTEQQQQHQIQQQLKDLERQQQQLIEQQQRLQQQLELLRLNPSNVQQQQLIGQQGRQQEQQLVQLEPLQMHGQRSNGQPFQQQQLLVHQRTLHEQQQVQQPQLKEQQIQRENLMQQQLNDVQPVVHMASRNNRSELFGFQGQQKQPMQQHYETSTVYQAFQLLRHDTPSRQNIQSSTSPFPPYGMADSSQGLPFQLSSSQSQRDLQSSSSASGFQSLSNTIQRQESDPISPTGSSIQYKACKLEITQPTYIERATPKDLSSSTTSSGPRSYDHMNFPVYGTVNKSCVSGDLRSNESLTLDAGTPSKDQRHLLQHGTITTLQSSFGSSSFAGAQNLRDQPRTMQTSPLDGSKADGGMLITPESYWIQQARPDSNDISTTSSVGSSHLTPLTVDVTRIQRWTGGSTQGQSSPSFYADRSSGGSLSSSRDGAVDSSIPSSVNFVKDRSHLWYKPHVSRDEVISTLKDKAVGSFIVRDSNTYPGSFALAVKVAAVPTNAPMQKCPEGDPSDELVRHFLIEPTPTGVRLKGYKNESVFGSLAALIYQHSITSLSLPCRLRLPTSDASAVGASRESDQPSSSCDQLVYCAFNVLYLTTVGIELLTGPVALDRVTSMVLEASSPLKTTVVNLKITPTGVTLTDNNRILFFRRHFPADLIRYCGLDRRLRCWTYQNELTGQITKNKIFGIVSRRSGLSAENECHLFAELDSNQNTSSTIISFVNQITQERDRK